LYRRLRKMAKAKPMSSKKIRLKKPTTAKLKSPVVGGAGLPKLPSFKVNK
jgi:hypothetical protein